MSTKDWATQTNITRFITIADQTLAFVQTVAINPAYDGESKTIREAWALAAGGEPDCLREEKSFETAMAKLQCDIPAFEGAVLKSPCGLAAAVAQEHDTGRLIQDSPLGREILDVLTFDARPKYADGVLTFHTLETSTQSGGLRVCQRHFDVRDQQLESRELPEPEIT